jgi:hypothetical protein
MKTIEIIQKIDDTEEVVFTETVEDDKAADLLVRAKLQAELWTRDRDGEYEAREAKEETEV